MTQEQGILPSLDQIEPSSTSFFIDFDGTLAAIVDRPEQVVIEDRVRDAVERLQRGTGNAIAIVSGRPIAQLDTLLAPFRPQLAGVHGLEFRDGEGHVTRAPFDAALLDEMVAAAQGFTQAHEGLIAESKPGSVSIHYRLRPDLGEAARAFAAELHQRFPGSELLNGKMVAELRFGGRSKADAVSHFQARAPFSGRTPVFIGDDVTDEDGFRRAAELGGYGIKVGAGRSMAAYRAIDIAALWDWLDALAARFERIGARNGAHRPDRAPPAEHHGPLDGFRPRNRTAESGVK